MASVTNSSEETRTVLIFRMKVFKIVKTKIVKNDNGQEGQSSHRCKK